jgi:hypothetical protein
LYDVLTIPPVPASGTSVPISGGKLNLTPPSNSYYLNIPPTDVEAANSKIVEISLPDGSAEAISIVYGNIIALKGENTETDYVFFEEYDDDGEIQRYFYVLNVTISGPTEAKVTVTFSLADGTTIMTVSPDSISQAAFKASGLTLTATSVPGATYSWKYDNVAITGTTNTVVVQYTDDAIGWARAQTGAHTVSLEMVVGGTTYSKTFTVIVATLP